jgi:hypothetical protein
MTTTSSPRRAGMPRKRAAAPPADHITNGAAAPQSTPLPELAPQPAPEPLPNLVTAGTGHPYGDRQIFVWRPAGGGDPIVLPHIDTVKTSQAFFAKIYDLNPMFQGFEWLMLAGVPKAIRLRVAALGDTDPDEQNRLYQSWFAPMSAPTGGEPPPES